MLVEELIEKLKGYNPKASVWVDNHDRINQIRDLSEVIHKSRDKRVNIHLLLINTK